MTVIHDQLGHVHSLYVGGENRVDRSWVPELRAAARRVVQCPVVSKWVAIHIRGATTVQVHHRAYEDRLVRPSVRDRCRIDCVDSNDRRTAIYLAVIHDQPYDIGSRSIYGESRLRRA